MFAFPKLETSSKHRSKEIDHLLTSRVDSKIYGLLGELIILCISVVSELDHRNNRRRGTSLSVLTTIAATLGAVFFIGPGEGCVTSMPMTIVFS